MTAGPDAPVPLVDLAWQHAQVADEVAAGFASVLERTAFIRGPRWRRSRRRSPATPAPGTWWGWPTAPRRWSWPFARWASAPATAWWSRPTPSSPPPRRCGAGATCVLVDCDPEHQLIDPVAAGRAVADTDARAVVGVDLFGQRAPLEDLALAVADRDCAVIEDAAQSQGATRHGAGIGQGAAVAATSFYPGKNLARTATPAPCSPTTPTAPSGSG
ncbi:MAG: DegT/DnrJ/EryC1/StrS family aminotransferase [Acidimicrobiales bacterium]